MTEDTLISVLIDIRSLLQVVGGLLAGCLVLLAVIAIPERRPRLPTWRGPR